ncbi:MAG: phosphopyruvate hydratase [Thermoplasmata archaeon]
MAFIEDAKIREVIDSRGNPTVEVDIITTAGGFGRAIAPSGASKGSFEVKDYPIKGIDEGITIFKEKLVPELVGMDSLNQGKVDLLLHELDGTTNFSNIGGNVAVAISLANAKAAADSLNLPLYKYLGGMNADYLPTPVSNIIGGGKHAIGGTVMQEFLSIAFGKTLKESIFANIQVHKNVGSLLKSKFPNIPLGLGDEKAWVAAMDDLDALELLSKATKEVSREYGIDIFAGIDLAASEFYKNGKYVYKDKTLSAEEQIEFVAKLVEDYNVYYVEDPLDENDFDGFAKLTEKIGDNALIVGDDLFVTNKERLGKGIEVGAANAVLIKPNQIGTLTDMIDTVKLAKENDYTAVISHRSGETEDSTISHLAVGLNIEYIKAGTIGGERTAKYNELIRIEEYLEE